MAVEETKNLFDVYLEKGCRSSKTKNTIVIAFRKPVRYTYINHPINLLHLHYVSHLLVICFTPTPLLLVLVLMLGLVNLHDKVVLNPKAHSIRRFSLSTCLQDE